MYFLLTERAIEGSVLACRQAHAGRTCPKALTPVGSGSSAHLLVRYGHRVHGLLHMLLLVKGILQLLPELSTFTLTGFPHRHATLVRKKWCLHSFPPNKGAVWQAHRWRSAACASGTRLKKQCKASTASTAILPIVRIALKVNSLRCLAYPQQHRACYSRRCADCYSIWLGVAHHPVGAGHSSVSEGEDSAHSYISNILRT